MSIRLGTTNPSAFRLGNTAVSKLMLGTTEVWSSVFDPMSLSPALWLDASDSSTLFNAVTGGSLPTNGQSVARWQDKSGNARHATQSDSTKRPLRITSSLNSKDIIRFDGTNDRFTAALSSTATQISIFGVFLKASAGGSNNFYSRLIGAWNTSANAALVGDYGSTDGICVFHTSQTVGGISAPAMHAWRNGSSAQRVTAAYATAAVYSVIRSGTSLVAHRNGTAMGSAGTTSATAFNFNQVTIGDSPSESDSRLNGDIAEILIYPTALSTTNRQAVQNYLGAKWGITVA